MRGSTLLCSTLNRARETGNSSQFHCTSCESSSENVISTSSFSLFIYTRFYRKNALPKRRDFLISRLFQLIWLPKWLLTIMELNWQEQFGDGRYKTTSFREKATTAKQFISCRGKNENDCKWYNSEKCSCKAY